MMMGVGVKIVGAVLILLFSIGYNNKTENKKAEAEAFIADLVGKMIVSLEDISYRYHGRDAIFADTNAPYEELVYTDKCIL